VITEKETEETGEMREMREKSLTLDSGLLTIDK
jgi:hypothetical protein